jgi:uncharacterized membrane protein YhaH (DUF805 family)
MTFGEAIANGWHRYAEFTGRASRSELWWWVLFVLLVAAALSIFDVVPLGTATLGYVLVALWWVATLLPTLAVGVRRLSDSDFGWGHWLWVLVPVAGVVVLAVLWSQPPKTPVETA